MGIWGPGLFDDDRAMDVTSSLKDALDSGLSIPAALQRVLNDPPWGLEDEEDGSVVCLALAALHLEYGILQPELLDRALAILNTGAGLGVWEEAGPPNFDERKQVLEQFR